MSPPKQPGPFPVRMIASIELNFGVLFELANDARLLCMIDNEVEADDPSAVFALRKHALSSIILNVSACEAFINELALDCEGKVQRQPNGFSVQTGELSRTLPALEEAHATLLTKFRTAATILFGQKPDLGAQPFQDFADLIGLRNELVHVKEPSLVKFDGPTPETEIPKFAARLLGRRSTTSYRHARNYHWIRRLMRRWVADWACDTARSICQHVIGGIPEKIIAEYFERELESAFVKESGVTS